MELYISPAGDDSHTGSIERPLRSLSQALQRLADSGGGDGNTFYLRGGTHFLNETIRITPELSRESLTIRAYKDEVARIGGGRHLECDCKPFRDGIFGTEIEQGVSFTQMFADGKRQVRARFPNKGELRPELIPISPS